MPSKGHRFASLEEENDICSHGNDRGRHPHSRHDPQAGRQALRGSGAGGLAAAAAERFPFFHEGQRIVHRDGHVEVAKAYYSVPPEYLGHTLWVRWDLRLVRIFNGRMEQIAVHARQEPGRFSTLPDTSSPEDQRCRTWGGVSAGPCPAARRTPARWAENMLPARGIEGVRVLQGFLSLRSGTTPSHRAGL